MARQGLTSSDVELAGGSRLPTECGPCFLGKRSPLSFGWPHQLRK